jgi:hypothetical protein
VTPEAIEQELRRLLLELQRTGDVSPQLDVQGLPLTSTLCGVGLDSVARVGLAALIDEHLGVWLEDDQVHDDISIADMVAKIANAKGNA